MKILCQRDPLWADKKIGGSYVTLGRYGCTITCISMITDYAGAWIRPDEIAKHKDWFTKDGLVLWSKLLLPAVTFEKRLYGKQDAEIIKSLKDPHKAVILQVQNYHWVLCLGQNWNGSYRIADPWTGKKANISKYNDEITGSAHFNIF